MDDSDSQHVRHSFCFWRGLIGDGGDRVVYGAFFFFTFERGFFLGGGVFDFAFALEVR